MSLRVCEPVDEEASNGTLTSKFIYVTKSPTNTRPISPETGDEDEKSVVVFSTKELEVVPHPEAEICIALEKLAESEDWFIQYEAILMIRRIVIHHTYLIDEQHLKKFMDPINAACDNLRSAMSKNALLALAECFEFLGNPRIAQVMSNDKVLDALLRRSACEKRFLREAALFALEKLSKYSPSAIVIECAATHASSKNPKLCANAVKVIYNCLQELKTKKFHPTEFQDVRVLLKSLTIFLTGKDSGARKEAKASLDALAEMGGIRWFQNLVEKTLDERTGMKVLNECCRAGEGTSQDGKATVQGKSLRERIRQNFDCSST